MLKDLTAVLLLLYWILWFSMDKIHHTAIDNFRTKQQIIKQIQLTTS